MTPALPRRALLPVTGAVLVGGCTAPTRNAPSPPPATGSTPASTTSERDRLVAALETGGVALYLRHPATDRGGVDDARAPRTQQRLLSAEGEQQARDLGATFRGQGITAGRVLTSPSWRCRDAATIAFGRGTVDWGIQALLQDTDTRDERESYARALLARTVPPGEVLVLIGHSSNISAATGESVAEGAGVVVRPDGKGSYAALGALTAEDWAALSG